VRQLTGSVPPRSRGPTTCSHRCNSVIIIIMIMIIIIIIIMIVIQTQVT
jgi:hypothetical protein